MELARGITAAVGLGSNLGDRQESLTRALLALAALPTSRLLVRSQIVESAPVGADGSLAHTPPFSVSLLPSHGDDQNLVRQSSVDRIIPNQLLSGPGGPYLNAAAVLRTLLSADELLARLLQIERTLGRVRDPANRYAPRTIDLDLLVYGSEVRHAPGLDLPHPRMHERLFVLGPLAQIAPHMLVPGIDRTVAQLLAAAAAPAHAAAASQH